MLKLNQELIVRVEKIAQGAGGIGYYNSKTIFIPYTIPGDLVKVKIIELKKKYARARLIQIIESSKQRIQAPCSVFSQCGGCQWQMLNYQDQLSYKQSFLERQIQFIARKLNDTKKMPEVFPIVPSPNEYRYRRRLRFKVKDLQIGYFSEASHSLIPIDDCLLGPKELVLTLKGYIKSKKQDGLKTYEVDQDPKTLKIAVRDLTHENPPFTQVNPAINELLISTVTDWIKQLKLEKPIKMIELFSGQGNLTFDLIAHLPKGSQIIGVELNKKAYEKALARQVALGIPESQLVFVHGDANTYLHNSNTIDTNLLLVDPPRSGLDSDMIKAILKNKSMQHFIYISCDLSTWTRDVLFMLESSSWELTKVQAFDMFPQTDHFEILSLFSGQI
jgi:23S rRNA (uracil1939-C5)-methyltransferase